MSTQELSGRVYYDVGTMLQWTDQVWGTEGVINDEWDAILVSNSSHTLKVEHIAVRVTEGLGIYYFCVGLDGSLERSQIVYIHDGIGNALGSQCMGNEVVRTTIQVISSYDMVTCLHNVLQSVSNSGCTTGHCKSCYTAFESSNTILEHTLCRVGQSTVDITSIAKSETIGSML